MNKQDIVNYVMNTPHNTNKAVLNNMLNQLVESDGSSHDNMAILPKLTVTLNIDDIEHADAYGITSAVELNNGTITQATFNPPQTSQVWEYYIVPMATVNVDGNYLNWSAQIALYDESYTGYYALTISNTVNCTDDSNNPGNGGIIITDPTQPASCTMNAVYTLY